MVILLLLLLLLLVPIGVDVRYCDGNMQIYLRIASFTFRLYPAKDREKKQNKKTKKKKEKTVGSTIPDLSKDEVLDAVNVAVRSVKQLRFQLHKVKLHFISAGSDPYRTAMLYGYVSAAVHALGLPQRKQADIQLGVDFERETFYLDGYLSVTIKIYYICKLLCCLIVGMVPILWSRRKRLKSKEHSCAVKGKVA